MKTNRCFGVLSVVSLVAIGCAGQQGGSNTTVATLVCESKTLDGETKPKKVCQELEEGYTIKETQEVMTLSCTEEMVDGKSKATCVRIEGLECVKRIETGSRIPKQHCYATGEEKIRQENDQALIRQFLRNPR